MNKDTELKVGDYINWVADRPIFSWNVYGRVVDKDETTLTVITYDTFLETKISLKSESAISELKLSDKVEVQVYIESLISSNKIDKIQLKDKLEKSEKNILRLENLVKSIG